MSFNKPRAPKYSRHDRPLTGANETPKDCHKEKRSKKNPFQPARPQGLQEAAPPRQPEDDNRAQQKGLIHPLGQSERPGRAADLGERPAAGWAEAGFCGWLLLSLEMN